MNYKCFICGSSNICWDADYDAESVDADKNGIVHDYHCRSCQSQIRIYEPVHKKIEGYAIRMIDKPLAEDFLKRHHYLAQQGNGFLGKVYYGLFTSDNKFIGCIVFAGISVIETLIGAFEGFERTSCQDGFWELTRLAMDDDNKVHNLTSWFVSRAIRQLKHDNYVRAIISYADSKYHYGFIYQATNFKYYGLAPLKCDFFEKTQGGGERQVWRGSVKGLKGEWRERSRKHRYMIVYDKSLIIKWQEQPYPKGDNKEYELKDNVTQYNIFDYV